MVTATSQARHSMQRSAFHEAELLFQPRLRDRRAGLGGCPGCGGHLPIAPRFSRHRAPNRIEHDWHCEACGHEWRTVMLTI
jgi:hypothetical protein